MSALWHQIARDPNLLSAAVFGGCLLLVGLISVLWFALFQQDERRLRQRLERLQAGPRGPRPDQDNQPLESLRRDRQDSSIATFDRLIKRALPNVNLLRLRLARSGWPLKIGDYLLACLVLGAMSAVALAVAFDLSLLISALLAIVTGVGLPHARPPLERMLRIHQAVQGGSYPNATRLAAELEVSSKSVHRDLEFMRDRLGLPLAYDPVRHGYHYTEEVSGFPTLQITEGELFALLVAERALQQYRGTHFERPLASAFRKLAASLPDTVSIAA